jgi:sugar lactone lactonase YvrE
MPQSSLTSVDPSLAVEGGRVSIRGRGFAVDGPSLPRVSVGDQAARVVFASPTRLDILVPAVRADAPVPVRVDGSDDALALHVGAVVATGLHQVDSPVVDREGNLFVTYSGTRGQQVPVSIFKVGPGGTRDTYSSSIVNPTSLALDAEGQLFVSSRFEGAVYRVDPDGAATSFATDLGVACGLAFTPDGTLLVGDRSGTIFAVDRAGTSTTFATLPASVAAFHLAVADDTLYVTAPTLAPSDAVYRISLIDRHVSTLSQAFGRPQGLAVSPSGALYVVDALAGASGLYEVDRRTGERSLAVAAPGLIGVAFDRAGVMYVCSNDTAYRFRQAS